LAASFGTTAQFWLNVQDAWDLWHELQRGSQTYGAIFAAPPARGARGGTWGFGTGRVGKD